MKKLVTFVSHVRFDTLLCCSAAVLLSACGGGSSDPKSDAAAMAPQLLSSVQVNPPAATVGAAAADGSDSEASQEASEQPALTAAPDSGDDTMGSSLAPESDSDLTAVAQEEAPELGAATEDYSEAAIANSAYHLYVSTKGNDNNAGTLSSPFRTLARAAKSARPSTTIHVAAGTYHGNVKTTVHGSATARIRYVSDTKWGAKLVGSGKEAQWTNNANYTDIIGFDISGTGRQGIVNWGSYTLVAGNHIHHIKVSGGCNGSGGAGVVNANYSGSDGDIIGNVVNDIGTPGKCNGVQGIYSSNKRGKIMNNIVYRNSSYGIHLWHGATNVLIANNTVFANGSSKMGGGILTGTGDKPGNVVLNYTRVINNIVYKNPAAGIKQYCYSGQSCIGSTNTTANNLVYGNGTNISLRRGTATGTVTADPQFVNFNPNGNGNYRLKGSSPAVNRGTSTQAPAYDFDNAPRKAGVDIGAYESF